MTHNFGPWITHEGNECPVEPDALVQVVLRGGTMGEAIEVEPEPALCCDWHQQSGMAAIFAYRKVIAPERVKLQGYIYGLSCGKLVVCDGDYPTNSASFTLSVEIDEDDKPVPGTVRLEDA